MLSRLLPRALQAFADWALSKNAAGAYAGEDDKRWAYTIETDGRPYLTRVLFSNLLPIKKWTGVGVYLHKFHRADDDRFLHNHPWEWAASVLLCGSYDEERLQGVVTSVTDGRVEHRTLRRRVRWFNTLSKSDYHRVLELHGEVWTLFFTGPRLPTDWGFLVDGEHVPWREFLKKGNQT